MQYSDVTPNLTGTVRSKFKSYFYTVTIHQQNKRRGYCISSQYCFKL